MHGAAHCKVLRAFVQAGRATDVPDSLAQMAVQAADAAPVLETSKCKTDMLSCRLTSRFGRSQQTSAPKRANNGSAAAPNQPEAAVMCAHLHFDFCFARARSRLPSAGDTTHGEVHLCVVRFTSSVLRPLR